MANLEYNQKTSVTKNKGGIGVWVTGLLPVIIMAGIIYAIVTVGLPFFGAGGPPVNELDFKRIIIQDGQVIAKVQNTGSAEMTIAQVQVNEAYVNYSIEPSNVLPRLGEATITIPFHWVEEEPIGIGVVNSIGEVFEGEVAVAKLSPVPNMSMLGMFALIGIFVGVIPVLTGLLWKPFLARIGPNLYKFFLSLTVGLLAYLAVDALGETVELAIELPAAFQGIALILFGVFISMYSLVFINNKITGSVKGADGVSKRLALAYMISVGIGLHNFGEGLAIGAAYSLGEVALGAFLIIGFMIHNVTEGLAIVAPISREDKSPSKLIFHLIMFGLIAGGPTILGTWIGGFVYSNYWSLIFLSIGAGAIFQVIYEITKMMAKKNKSTFGDLPGGLGIIAGMLIMYITGLYVVG
jgi:ZIP family zinc transporter